MRIKVTRDFNSRVLGQCLEGQELDCDDELGKSIIGSHLAEQIKERPAVRRTKTVRRRKVETGALDIETA
jgi:hypothetical protein